MQLTKVTVSSYFRPSTGKKYVMAVSGFVLVLFVIGHLLGNLQVFLGQDTLNEYANFLQNLGEWLWIARIGLIFMLVVHVWTSVQLTLENRAARPVDYGSRRYIKANTASRTMIYSGLVIFSFLVYHLLQFTFLKVHPEWAHLKDARGRHDVYSMVVRSFQEPAIAVSYVAAIFLLCFHLSHGLSSMFQSIGLQGGRIRRILDTWGPRVAWLIFAGYAAIPTAIVLHLVRLPAGVLLP
ncbi:MAG TPA: succinate dehydrogenase cytochrome b subunit [Elusimicrobiota bacterium]|nr:succinate dehydrogenase cytochrome b subunit [Elusimicrobiota bacterium]